MAALGSAVALAPAAAPAKSQVVATLPDLWALTVAVAGDALEVKVATRLGQNPHDLEIRPSQILLLSRAQVLVRNGLEEDSWVDPIVEGSGNSKLMRGSANVIEAVRGVQVLKIPTGPVDRSLGDVHPSGNPHFTLDPGNIPPVTANIVGALSRLFPDLAGTFERNRAALLQKVADADRRWKSIMAPHRGKKVVSYHDSWPYFYRAFGLVDGGIEEDRPGVPPSPQHLTSLIRRMKDENIKVILLENWYPPDLSNFVARETGAKVLAIPQSPGAAKGTEDYIAHMDYLVNAIARALE